MKNNRKVKSIAILVVTLGLFFGLGIWSLAAPDAEVSRAERRKLEQAPELSLQSVFSGTYMTDLETYLLDQFPLRDTWRTLKAVVRFDVFRQLDNNGIYLSGDSVCKMETELKEDQIQYAAEKINEVMETYLDGMPVYWAVVPDKNVYAAGDRPQLDTGRMLELMQQTVNPQATYVDLFGLLSLDDYYRTDTHWRQEAILPVAQALGDTMGLPVDLSAPVGGFTQHTLEPFYGVYFGQSALNVPPDTLCYLTSEATDVAVMTGLEFEGERPVYDPTAIDGMDGYNVFAGGPQAIVTIESPKAQTNRELVIFRDSFGSSLAPLFLEGYSKVTLIDLRYIPASLVGDYVTFEDQDVLFLYSTSLLNSGMLLR